MQEPLENYLDTADGAAKVMAHARLLIKLSRLYQQIAPAHLGQASTLANYKSKTMVIHADNGAVAAKLRQLAPTLANGFSQRGFECNDVQIKVQAWEIGQQSTGSTKKPLSDQASRTLETLRDSLPDDGLRQAIDHLLTRALR